MDIELPKSGSQLDSVRVLRNAMDDYVFADEKILSDYQRAIHQEKAEQIRRYYKDLDRVVNFIAVYDGYVKENLSQERFCEVLDRLETEALSCREPSMKGKRVVLVDVGEPMNLFEYYEQYKIDIFRRVRNVYWQSIKWRHWLY